MSPPGHEPGDAPADPGDGPDGGADDVPGGGIIALSQVTTAVFVAVSAAATVAPDSLAGPAAVVHVALFAVGVVAFLQAYAVAVNRSRTDAIGIGGLFFLADSAPRSVRVRLLGALAVQVVVAVVAASIRPYTAVAFGILVPVLGLGLAGLWGARHGTFPPRSAASPSEDEGPAEEG